MRRVHERRGSTRGNIVARGEIDPDDTACLTLPELERILALEIDSYNHTLHEGIGERPLDRYSAYFKRTDLPEGSRLPPLLPPDRLLLDFMPFERRQLVRTGFRLFRVDYSSRDLLAMWHRQNGADIERVLIYDPRSLATVWVVDDVSGDYIAVPYRVPRPDMTLAESQAARASLQTLKAADRTEARLFDNVLKVRAIEEAGRTTTSRLKAERSRQARRATARPSKSAPLGTNGDIQEASTARVPFAAPAVITAFEDVEDL